MRGQLAALVRRAPLLAVALCALLAICTLHWAGPGWAGVLVSGLTGLALWLGGRGAAWVVVLVASFAAGSHAWREAGRSQAETGLARLASATVTAVLLEDGRGNGRFWQARARLQDGPYPGKAVLWEGRGEAPVEHARVTASGSFRPLPKPRNPGEFDQAAWLRRQGVAAVFHSRDPQARVETGRWAAFGARVRSAFRESVTDGLPADAESTQVIRAVVIGEHPVDAEHLVRAYRESGTLHVFCVSGMHVGLVGALGWLLLRSCGVSRRAAILLLVPLMFGYAWITGNGPPAVRAAWMAAVFLGAFLFRRQPNLLNALGAVLLALLLWDGSLLFHPGVQLSYGVVAAIAIGARLSGRLFERLAQPETYQPRDEYSFWQRVSWRFRQKTAASLAVSTAAWAGSAPLAAYHFALFTPISIVASVLLMPLVFGMLALALTSAALHPVLPTAARGLNVVNAGLAKACTGMARGCALVPGGHAYLRREGQPILLVYDLKYGAGAACLSGGKSGGAVLIDAGDAYSFRRRVLPSLRWHGIRPETMLISHPDGSHLGGGAHVWRSLPLQQALLPVARSRSAVYRSWLDEAPQEGVKTTIAAPKLTLPLPDDAMLEILHTPDPLAADALADDRVAVFRIDWRGWRILFTSDAGLATERSLLGSGQDLRADVIVAGRHQRDLSLGDDFIAAVSPRAIVASNSDFPQNERLPARAVRYWRSLGIEVLDQAQTGGVTFRVADDGALRLLGFADSSEVRLPAEAKP
jgi:competence protein ComEC